MVSYRVKRYRPLGVTSVVALCVSVTATQAGILSHHQRLTQGYAADTFLETTSDIVSNSIVDESTAVELDAEKTVLSQAEGAPQRESLLILEEQQEKSEHELKSKPARSLFIAKTPEIEPLPKEVFKSPDQILPHNEDLLEDQDKEKGLEPEQTTVWMEQLNSAKDEVIGKAEPSAFEQGAIGLVINKELIKPDFQPLVYGVSGLERKTVSIQELIRTALNWHPSVRQAQSQALASEQNIRVAKAGYYPKISTDLSSAYRNSSDQNNETLSVNASQMLYDFGKTSSTVREAEHGFFREQANLDLTREQLIQNTVLTALELMRLQEKEMIAQQQIEELNRIWELAKERAELGASTQSDPLQALSRKEAAIALMWELQAQKDTWQQQLQSLTGYTSPLVIDLDFPNYLGSECTHLQLNLDSTPEMRIAEEMRLAALAALDKSSADLYPTLSLDLGYDQYLKSRSVLRNGQIDRRNSDFSVGLNINMSLFEGGGRFARRGAYMHLLQAANSEKETVALSLSQGFEESKTRQSLLNGRLGVLQERVVNIEKAKAIYLDQYLSLGTRSLLDLLNAEQEIYQAKADYIDNKYEMYKAQVMCLYYGAQLKYVFNVP